MTAQRRRVLQVHVQAVWGLFAGVILLFAGTTLSGCRLAEPHLVPRRSIELLSSLQPNTRPRAKVPAIRQSDRGPVLIDYRALQINDAELARINAHPAKFYRMHAAQRHPLVLIGGVILGMALPHFLLGLSVGLDNPSPRDERAITDVPGGVLALTLAGLHLVTGITLIGIGERNPRIEPADPQLLYQYMDSAP
jgi:hypothetical protein